MDKLVINFVKYYPTLIHHTINIGVLIAGFVALCGCIRFGIAVWRRHKGIYPPATSQMGH
ncbi:MAG: hypothetical protein A2W19_07125 [Spirochaetes bacterium RBG_16_49_21]|nr:MAG: hypothetical protein A2W19_07125 [Spirochaetes bacterium RBG_16_49_21]